MTNDYKENLIDYVTNLLSIEQGTSKDVNIVNQKYYLYSGNEWSNIRNTLKDIGTPFITGILQNEKYDVSVVYGTIQISNEDERGFLIYLDNNLLPIQLITQYNSGTNLKGIHKLYLDETNNRCYGVVGHCYASNNSYNNYFVYFNNLFFKVGNDYEVDLRYSYDIGDNGFACWDIVKDPDNAYYLMIGSSASSRLKARAIELKINVGSSNEIKRWTPSDADINNIFVGCYAYYSSGNPNFKIFKYNYNNNYLGILYNSGDTLNSNDLYYANVNNVYNIYLVLRSLEYQAINENEIYFSVPMRWELTENGTTNRGELSILYKYNGSTITEIYRTPVGIATQVEPDTYRYDKVYQLNIIKDTNNTLYLLKFYSNDTNNNTIVQILNLSNHISSITDNDWITIGSYVRLFPTNIALNQTTFLIRKYNLCKICNLNSYIYYDNADYINGFELIIDNLSPINGYNGDAFSGVDCLVPQYSNLYSNGTIVFSRNLYNITKQNNQSMSSVEIPETYLNDLTITQNDLISKTNVELVNDTTEWNKNIYEVVDLNFINTISVIDEDTNTPYLNSAIKVNNAVTDGGNTNYQNTPCTKYRINYLDTTTSVDDLVWTSIDDTHKETEISLYVDKAIVSIDLISSDETTIYLTIPLNVIVGKYYTINQKIRIE